MTQATDRETRSEKLARLNRELERADDSLARAKRAVPRNDRLIKRLRKDADDAWRALNRLRNDWFPPEYADCVDGFVYCWDGPNIMKIRSDRTGGSWREHPVHPLDEPPMTR